MVLVKGRCERDDETARVLAAEIAPIEMVRERLASSVAITLSSPRHDRETFVRLWDVLMQHKGDRRVAIELLDPERHLRVKIDVNAQIRVRPSERLVSEVERICGAGSVSLRPPTGAHPSTSLGVTFSSSRGQGAPSDAERR
jgi:DNA polymerase-3 subunit alpha